MKGNLKLPAGGGSMGIMWRKAKKTTGIKTRRSERCSKGGKKERTKKKAKKDVIVNCLKTVLIPLALNINVSEEKGKRAEGA